MSFQPSNPIGESKKKLGKLISVIVVVIVVLVGAYFAIKQFITPAFKTIDIAEYISDGGSKVWSIKDYGSKLEVKLTSQYDDMRVTIVVDGSTVYDRRTWSVNFETNLGYGYHVIQIAIENPTIFGLGRTILVTGYVRYG
uniref:Uncharacterized protein n=1 Tax=Ignisphaera aggregans TaxID=334771 RepID=A0A7J2U0J9_9CREN